MPVDHNDGTVHLPRPPVVKRRLGRPSKLTEEIIERIRLGMASGAYVETAAAQAGINPDTLRVWLREGARGKSALHRKFSATIEKAEAESEMRAVATIQEFARGMTIEITKTTTKGVGDNQVTETTVERRPVREWTAAAWYLERRKPGRWGRRVIELQGSGGKDLIPSVRSVIVLPAKATNVAGGGSNSSAKMAEIRAEIVKRRSPDPMKENGKRGNGDSENH